GRSLASLSKDDAWYEAATRALLEHIGSAAGPTPADVPMLWTEIARLRFAQRDEAGAEKAIAQIRETEAGAWLGRVLDGLASFGDKDADAGTEANKTRAALEELTASVTDPAMRRSLSLVCAIRAHAAGDGEAAVKHLKELA